MAQKTNQTRQIQFLLTNLLLLLICILGLVFGVTIYPVLLAPDPTSTSISILTRLPSKTLTFTPTITPTPTSSRTLRPTFSPTISLTPSWTPTFTPTPTATSLATLTPARPVAFAGHYLLAEWTPERADYLVSLLRDYPNTLSITARGKDDVGYFRAFQFSVFALHEALMRFPDAPQAKTWRWRLAYHLAQLDDPQAGQLYANYIDDALIRGETDFSQLYLWFQEQEPRMALYMVPTHPPAGYEVSYLVEVRAKALKQAPVAGEGRLQNARSDETQSSAGSAFIWLLRTDYGEYESQVLVSHFDFAHPIRAGWIVADLDGQPAEGEELAIYYSTPRNQFTLDAPTVFDLSGVPAVQLPFLPQTNIFSVGMEYENRWAVVKTEAGIPRLAFQSTIFPACPVKITILYRWNGQYFEIDQDQYVLQRIEYQSGKIIASLGYCRLMVEIASTHWGPKAVVSLMEALLPDWPPETDEKGNPFSPDARDEWLYRLGVQHSLLGNREASQHYFNQIIQTPSLPNSRWIEPAQRFKEGYQSSEDIYRLCVAAQFCDAGYALVSLVEKAPSNQDLMTYLAQKGVTIVSSAFYDFDLDGENERWITVRHQPMGRLELWILANYSSGIKALRVGYVDTNPPSLEQLAAAYVHDDGQKFMPAVLLENKKAISLQRLPDTRAPYLVSVPLRSEYLNRFLLGLQSAQGNLFLGGDPATIQADLLALSKNPGMICENTWSCDPYYYLLGLVYELEGNEEKAVEAYHRLWMDYSNSPYTIMVRLKLEGMSAQPTITQTPTPSPSPTLATGTPTLGSPTPTLTRTLTPTAQGTPTPTITGTLFTPTPTLTPTRTPSMTATQIIIPTSTSTITITPTPTETERPYPIYSPTAPSYPD